MTHSQRFFLHDCGIASSIGISLQEVTTHLFSGSTTGITEHAGLIPERIIPIGRIDNPLPCIPDALHDLDCRNNRILQITLEQIVPTVDQAIKTYGAHRIAVIIGTSTSGMSDGEDAFLMYHTTGTWPQHYHYRKQETSNPSLFTARWFGITGPTYTIATACSSSAKVFASARRLIRTGIVDAAIIGGADTLCRTTLNGFNSLELLSSTRCNPFSANRNGITIGEGAAVFFMSKEEGPVELLGVGETSDAYHTTAPDPKGHGAIAAMQLALMEATLTTHDISYINLHGTASTLNDAMESRAVSAVFGHQVPCSSTKSMTGHTLGAAGAIEAAFLWLTLNPATTTNILPPHLWDGVRDTSLPQLHFVTPNTSISSTKPLAMLSNSFGFGGSNVALILGRR